MPIDNKRSTQSFKLQASSDEARYAALTVDLMRQYLDIIGCTGPSRGDVENAADVVMSAVAHVGTKLMPDVDEFNKALESAGALIVRAYNLGWRHPRVRIVHRYFSKGNDTVH